MGLAAAYYNSAPQDARLFCSKRERAAREVFSVVGERGKEAIQDISSGHLK